VCKTTQNIPLWSSKSTFTSGLPVNGKRDHSSPESAHDMLHDTVVTAIFAFITADTLFTT
jgi:hypothetical protein